MSLGCLRNCVNWLWNNLNLKTRDNLFADFNKLTGIDSILPAGVAINFFLIKMFCAQDVFGKIIYGLNGLENCCNNRTSKNNQICCIPGHKSWGKHHKNIYGLEMRWKLLINCKSNFPRRKILIFESCARDGLTIVAITTGFASCIW